MYKSAEKKTSTLSMLISNNINRVLMRFPLPPSPAIWMKCIKIFPLIWHLKCQYVSVHNRFLRLYGIIGFRSGINLWGKLVYYIRIKRVFRNRCLFYVGVLCWLCRSFVPFTQDVVIISCRGSLNLGSFLRLRSMNDAGSLWKFSSVGLISEDFRYFRDVIRVL